MVEVEKVVEVERVVEVEKQVEVRHGGACGGGARRCVRCGARKGSLIEGLKGVLRTQTAQRARPLEETMASW